jgi:hypothetical protein
VDARSCMDCHISLTYAVFFTHAGRQAEAAEGLPGLVSAGLKLYMESKQRAAKRAGNHGSNAITVGESVLTNEINLPRRLGQLAAGCGQVLSHTAQVLGPAVLIQQDIRCVRACMWGGGLCLWR